MTRPTPLSAMRTCRPLFAGTSNGFGSAACRRPFAMATRQLHVSPTRAHQSSPQRQQQPEIEAGPSSSSIANSDLNPPAMTRPPPLHLPVRQPDTSTFVHLFNTGKAYLTFYKTGLRQIWSMTKAVRSLPSIAQSDRPTRSAILLRARWSHDMRRLPLFVVLFVVCGEFTPFVVLFLPQAVPFACRIPKQVRKLRLAAQERRRSARAEMGSTVDHAAAERVLAPLAARMLGLVGGAWDRVGWVPTSLAARRVAAAVRFLAADDGMIVDGGGVEALEEQEVMLACVDRGIDTVDREVEELRRVLARWLSITTRENLGEEERIRLIERLVVDGEENWPSP